MPDAHAAVPRVCHFATEAVFERDCDGRLWAIEGFGEALWSGLLEIFDGVHIIARVKNVARSDLRIEIADPRVAVFALPFYKGLSLFLRALPRFCVGALRASALPGPFLLRLPGPIGTFVGFGLLLRGKPYGLQLVGDTYDVMSGPVFRSWLRPARTAITRATQIVCAKAAVISYVTGQTLQRRYPPGKAAEVIPFSDIDLPPNWFVTSPRDIAAGQTVRLFLCGSLAQLYKGVDVLIEAVARLRAQDLDVVARVAGDGAYRPQLEALARANGIEDRVAFLGALPHDAILAELDDADIFVMPSRTEGMPRALIEAFARAVPAIGSRVGGIPELLDDGEMVPVDDVAAFADAIAALAADPQRYRALSDRNLEVARDYSRDRLIERRRAFYGAIAALADMT